VKRRIVEAIVGVSAVILLALGIPLSLLVHRSILDTEVVELQAKAARALVEVGVPLDRAQLERVSREPDAQSAFSVYDAKGVLVFGTGPASADQAVRTALDGTTASSVGREIVVASPVVDPASEAVVGAMRLAGSRSEADRRVRSAWAQMGGAGVVALAVGWLIARRLARTLARPLTDLAGAAVRLGDGGSFEPVPASGITEIDTLASALSHSSERINDALARERRFSADVSHQLRTPLTRMRLRLERTGGDESDALQHSLDDLKSIEDTVEHLLAFSRDAMPSQTTVDLDRSARRAGERWHDRASAERRSITVTSAGTTAVQGSSASVDQILDVLIDNAIHHGRGDISIDVRLLMGGAAIDVGDEGAGIDPGDGDRIFDRGHGSRTGIGLSLARSLAEAEGGRLVLVHSRPAKLSLILLDPDEAEAAQTAPPAS
jgi:signal transduction histidine kinase